MRIGTSFEVKTDRHTITFADMSHTEYSTLVMLIECGLKDIGYYYPYDDLPEHMAGIAEILAKYETSEYLRRQSTPGLPDDEEGKNDA